MVRLDHCYVYKFSVPITIVFIKTHLPLLTTYTAYLNIYKTNFPIEATPLTRVS